MRVMGPQRGLYAITQQTVDDDALIDWATSVIEGGACCLQYRDKRSDAASRQRQASQLALLCKQHRVTFIVNDDVELALSSQADGVHLGENDGDIASARAHLGPDRLIGVSCYGDLQRATSLASRGADHLAFGAFFSSSTKPEARTAAPGVLAAARALGRPVVAIGGITPDNGGELIRAGADLLAVIGGLAGTPDQAFQAARRYVALFDQHSSSFPEIDTTP